MALLTYMHELLNSLWAWFGNNTAEVIALCALFFTAYQACATRHHNKLSVKPHLSETSERTINTNKGTLKFIISNNGLGPAVITKWRVLLNAVDLKFSEHSSVESVINNVLDGRIFDFTIGTLGEGYVMPANESKVVLLVHCTINDEDDFKKIEKSLNKLDLYVEYKSMYGKSYILDTRKKHG